MQRSQQLGHCICDPKKDCPCDVFKKDGYCPCAGERPAPVMLDDVRLMTMAHNAGCASKIAPGDLEAVLSRLPAVADPAVVCGMPAGDDAGIYRLPDGTHLVQTVDVMTPCVDDPDTFGRICAANCLSDVYAMGGAPKTALSILGFPADTHDGAIMHAMMAGAMAVLAEAGVALIGGHSIKDEEVKLGFAVTGTIDPARISRRDAAAPGDLLVLTKPLGSGVLNFARQIGRDVDTGPVTASMAALNGPAAAAAAAVGVSACIDITGFGLFGHLVGMARASGVTAQVWADALPAFDGAVDALAAGVVPGAVERNTEFVAGDIAASPAVDAALINLGYDAQTSGGLLMAVPAGRLRALRDELAARGAAGWVVGTIAEESPGGIVVIMKDEDPCAAPAIDYSVPAPGDGEKQATADTAAPPQPVSDDGPARAFGALMRSAAAAGDIDAVTKELITFSLVLMGRCRGCFAAHYNKALAMGITRAQLDEAAWCATAMGGAVVRMFYKEMLEEVDGGEDACCC